MALNNVNRNWGYKYLFSLYFACSTMFTVGYGDITPENTLEITTILVVQIVGKLYFTQELLTWGT